MRIVKIFGPGCYNCRKLEENVKRAAEENNLGDIKIEHVREINEIVESGIMRTPAVAVDGKMMAAGRVPDVTEIKGWLG